MERLQQELAALPGLEQLTDSQLRALPWRVKEQALLALFREQASSASVAQELQRRSRDRRLERRADKLLDGDAAVARRKEESFRADFMQAAAAELARLGAPALISWQKLLFDSECCYQAFRLLLTRIKSSKRSGSSGVTTNSSSLLAARYAAGGSRQRERGRRGGDNNNEEENDKDGGDDDSIADESYDGSGGRTRFPPLKPSHGSLSRVSTTRKKENSATSRSTSGGKLDWNFDTTVDTPPEEDSTDELSVRESTEKPTRPTRATSRHAAGAGISIERTVPTNQPSYFASKFKKNQVQALQEENAALTKENAKLREEIKQLEALNAVLQGDSSNNRLLEEGHPDSMQFAQRRMRLLQAQNMQLQRQISLLQDTVQAQANAETNLLSALNHWRGVIDAGREEAKAAGADQNAADTPARPEQSGAQRPIKWMLAVPDKLMDELERVEGQIRGAANTANACYETKLRVSKLSASFLRDGDTTVKLSEIYGREPSSLAHLRVDRVKQLEEALASVAAELDQLSAHVMERFAPKASTADAVRSNAYELSKRVRELLLEVGAFGAVVWAPVTTVSGSQSAVATKDGERITAIDVMKALSSTSGVAKGPGGAKEREKQAKVMLKQLHARYSAIGNNAVVCEREAEYWRTAWQTQDDLLRRLVKRVRHLGQKKVEWCQHYLLAPMTNLEEVFASFSQCYDENSTRQNPYLPLLVETLSMEHPMLQEALHQWLEYTRSVQVKMDELVADYEANRLVLASSAATPRSRSAPEYDESTLPCDSEQVILH